MPAVETPAIVLRRADYKDYDRMVTLFTPDHGRVDAIARGCRRPKSQLNNCTEPFTYGLFSLYVNKERTSIDQCMIRESYYDLRMDYERLTHGAYWLRLLESAAMPEVPMQDVFLITLRALAHLTYSALPAPLVTMAFEMHLMARLGFAPRMDTCLICGRRIDSDARFDRDMGGTVCLDCLSDAPHVSNGARRIMMKLPRTDFDKVDLVEGHPNWREAARLFRPYVTDRLRVDRNVPELPEDP
ncbi:MAG: DNA repair protein RecO [Clostridiales bacterium]|nr:DNA repair protein RecO [Clostridiales bacterium]